MILYSSSRRFLLMLIGCAIASAALWMLAMTSAPALERQLSHSLFSVRESSSQTISTYQPDGVINRYATSLAHHNCFEAYQLLAPELQRQWSYQSFVHECKAAAPIPPILKIELQPQTSDAKRLSYEVLTNRNIDSANQYVQKQDFTLVSPHSRKGAWKIEEISA